MKRQQKHCYQTNNKKVREQPVIERDDCARHGIPTLISFFMPGVGQVIKGDFGKAVQIWIGYAGIAFGMFLATAMAKELGDFAVFMMLALLFLLPVLWACQLYDAYNS